MVISHCQDHEDIAVSCKLLEEMKVDVKSVITVQQTILAELAVLNDRVLQFQDIAEKVEKIEEWKNRMMGAIGVLFIIITIYGVKIFV